MPKIRKQQRSKRYRYNVNRKRLRNKIEGTGFIKDPKFKKAWEDRKTVTQNIKEMGLSSDPNQTLEIPSSKKNRLQFVKIVNGFIEEDADDAKQEIDPSTLSKGFVVKNLEEDAKAPRRSLFRLPKGQVNMTTYYMEKYGTNFRAMERDKKNFDQLTWKQIRARIRKFLSIPEQVAMYEKLRKKNGKTAKIDFKKFMDCQDSDGEN